jgi:hypothetical protein
MKRYLCILLNIVIITVFFPLFAHALAGSCVMTHQDLDAISSVTWVCTGNSGDGTFPTTITPSPTFRGWVYSVDTTPGSPSPTASSGFTLLSSESSADVLSSTGSTMLGATANRVAPAISGWINGTLTPVITSNIVHGAIFTIRAWIWNQRR